MLENGNSKLLIIGDLVHIASIQLPNPDIAVIFDANKEKAVASRKRIFDMAAVKKMPIAAAHIAFPGIVILEKEGEGYTFKVLNK